MEAYVEKQWFSNVEKKIIVNCSSVYVRRLRMFKIIGTPRPHKKKGTSATKIMEEKIILFHSVIILTYVKIKKLKKKISDHLILFRLPEQFLIFSIWKINKEKYPSVSLEKIRYYSWPFVIAHLWFHDCM